MSEQPEGDPEVTPALEPGDLPHPLRAQDVEPLIEKEIALPMSVRLDVSAYALLQALLRLPDGVTLEDASVIKRDGDVVKLVVTVDFPGAPPGAVSADLTYTRRTALPDPVKLTGIRWFGEDGSEIKPEAVQPAFQTTTQVVEQSGIKPQEMT